MFNETTQVDNDELFKQLKTTTKRKFEQKDAELLEKIIEEDGFDSGQFKSSLITFSDVLRGNKRVGAKEYIKAVQFCSHMSTGDSQRVAYGKTFPDRVAAKRCEGTVLASASLYHKTDLVQGIMKMAQVPMHLIFMAERHKAMEKLVELMNNPDASHRIQMESADKIIGHVKAPEESKITLDMNIKNDALESLEATLEKLAQTQVAMIRDGNHSAKDVVDADLLTGGE